MRDRLTPILERTRRENARRASHRALFDPGSVGVAKGRSRGARDALRRPGGARPRVIAEIKFASPSEGVIRARTPGAPQALARGYVDAGAAAISVLADRIGFSGGALDVRRVARAIDRPVLFKGFVLDEIQLDLARACGAAMALLLVRALAPEALGRLVDAALERGLEPVVEAASEEELRVALDTRASVIGVNARDLATFEVDPDRARKIVNDIPSDRIAVYMSGVHRVDDLRRVAETRADAVLVGTSLMRAPDPGARLQELLEG